jgi:hypothetical protein
VAQVAARAVVHSDAVALTSVAAVRVPLARKLLVNSNKVFRSGMDHEKEGRVDHVET